jgi:hypothetical protein
MLDGKTTRSNSANGLECQNLKTLVAAGSKFELLRTELNLLDKLCSELRKQGHWSNQLEVHWDAHRERLLDDLQEIASVAITKPATCYTQLRVKAQILLEYCTPEGGDMSDLLGASICRDILTAKNINGGL